MHSTHTLTQALGPTDTDTQAITPQELKSNLLSINFTKLKLLQSKIWAGQRTCVCSVSHEWHIQRLISSFLLPYQPRRKHCTQTVWFPHSVYNYNMYVQAGCQPAADKDTNVKNQSTMVIFNYQSTLKLKSVLITLFKTHTPQKLAKEKNVWSQMDTRVNLCWLIFGPERRNEIALARMRFLCTAAARWCCYNTEGMNSKPTKHSERYFINVLYILFFKGTVTSWRGVATVRLPGNRQTPENVTPRSLAHDPYTQFIPCFSLQIKHTNFINVIKWDVMVCRG